MYEQFYGHFGLQRTPFQISPNPKEFVGIPGHHEALRQLLFAVESRKGLMLLTGEPGTGKTAVLYYLLDVLRRKGYSTAYVFHTLLSSAGVLRVILNDFGITCSSNDKNDLLSALRSWLIKRRQLQIVPVIVIDEAQALSDRALEDIGTLLNLEVSGANLLQIVLAGQPELESKLRAPKLKQVRQRVMSHARLSSLSYDETARYIRTRLNDAGAGNAEAFSPDSLREIYQYSIGNPRTIHLLCEHSLLSAYSGGRECVSAEDITRVAQEFELSRNAEPPDETPESDPPSNLELFAKPDFDSAILPTTTEITATPNTTLPQPELSAAFAMFEPQRQEIISPSPVPSLPISQIGDEATMSLGQAALWVASQKFKAAGTRSKEVLGNVFEAGRSVLSLGWGQEHQLMPKPLQMSVVASGTLADMARRGRESVSKVFSGGTPRPMKSSAETPVARNVTIKAQRVQRVVPRKSTAVLRTAQPAASTAYKKAGPRNYTASTRVQSRKTGPAQGYWSGVANSFRRDVRQTLEQCGFLRDRRETKKAEASPSRLPTGNS
jgi:general secretion pathway protein A